MMYQAMHTVIHLGRVGREGRAPERRKGSSERLGKAPLRGWGRICLRRRGEGSVKVRVRARITSQEAPV